MPLWETPDGMPPGLALPLHPGDARIHHIATLRYGTGRGDFTPQYVRQDIEIEITVLGQLLEQLGAALGIDHPGLIGSRVPPPVGGAQQHDADIEAG